MLMYTASQPTSNPKTATVSTPKSSTPIAGSNSCNTADTISQQMIRNRKPKKSFSFVVSSSRQPWANHEGLIVVIILKSDDPENRDKSYEGYESEKGPGGPFLLMTKN